MNNTELLKLVKEDINKKAGKYRGQHYYNYNPTFNNQDQEYIKNGIGYRVKSNKHETYVNYFKMLVTQKIDYLLAKKPTYDENLDSVFNIWSMLDKLMKMASLDGKTWLHFYVFQNQLKYIIVSDKEIIPIYYGDILIKIIRYYKLDKNTIIEVWTDTTKTVITLDENDKITDTHELSHYETTYQKLGMTFDGNFGMIPFLNFDNNKDCLPDYADIESLLNAYNAINDGFIDNVFMFQEALLLLKGFVGDDTEVRKVIEKLKKSKGLSLPVDGNAEYLKVDIPVEARQALLTILKEAIFTIGRGVDPSQTGDGNITNIVIQSRYVYLDLKSSDCIKRIIDFYDNFVMFISNYIKTSYSNILEFNKSILVNETENIANCIKSMNLLSKETILKNHPWVTDLNKELEQLEKDRQENLKNMEDEQKTLNNSVTNNNNML